MSGFKVYQDLAERTNGEFYLGVCGPVRTGKSTFIKLLLGLYRPDSGTIRINSQSVDAYCKHDMSRQFLYVGQEEIFLNETVENYLHIVCHLQLQNNVI